MTIYHILMALALVYLVRMCCREWAEIQEKAKR